MRAHGVIPTLQCTIMASQSCVPSTVIFQSSVLVLVALFGSCDTKAEHFPSFASYKGTPYKVTYDNRSLLLNGKHSLFLSGSVHPPRSLPGEWDHIFSRLVEHGLNMVELYTFWNFHEPVEGQYNWSQQGNLTRFVELAGQRGLFVNLRVGRKCVC